MKDELEKLIDKMNGMGDFINYGTLPKVCIHTPIPDNFSPYYVPDEKCKCGCTDFIDGEMKILKDSFGYEFPKKFVHRCKNCNEVRLAYLCQAYEKINSEK